MQSDPELFSRRHFLQWSAAGVASAGADRLLASSAQENRASGSERAAPHHPVILRSPQLEITLDGASGLPWRYKLPLTEPNCAARVSAGPSASLSAAQHPGISRPPASRPRATMRRQRRQPFSSAPSGAPAPPPRSPFSTFSRPPRCTSKWRQSKRSHRSSLSRSGCPASLVCANRTTAHGSLTAMRAEALRCSPPQNPAVCRSTASGAAFRGSCS
jgi:hypothetical protein